MKKRKLLPLIPVLALLALFPAGVRAEDGSASERITNNYTSVSAAWTQPVYAGDPLEIDTGSAVLSYGEESTLSVTVPEDGLYFLRFSYTSMDDSVLPIRLSLRVDGEYPYYECRTLTFETAWHRGADLTLDR